MSTQDGGRPTHGPLRRSSAALAAILTASLALIGPIRAETSADLDAEARRLTGLGPG